MVRVSPPPLCPSVAISSSPSCLPTSLPPSLSPSLSLAYLPHSHSFSLPTSLQREETEEEEEEEGKDYYSIENHSNWIVKCVKNTSVDI
jgi:hypothetical protein